MSSPNPQPSPRAEHQAELDRHRHHTAYASETAGLLLIAALLLALTLLRYWHAIHWSLR